MLSLRRVGVGVVILLLSSFILSACGNSKEEVNLFIWSEYMPESVIKQFEEETGIKVNYGTFSSNEEMISKISAGTTAYDLTLASDYIVDIMEKQKLMEPLNKDNIPNLKNIGPEFLDLDYDKGNKYTVPYMWGTVVVAVNTEKVTKPIESYEDLWDEEFKDSLVVLDDVRSMVGITNVLQGKSMNETDPKVLEESKKMLEKLKPNIKKYDSDSPKTMLVSGEVKAGIVWGAEASLARQENPNIKTVYPKEKIQIWHDNFVIPKGAPNKENAEKFIDFILRPEISAEISKEFPYGNPNIAAHKLIDKDIINDPAVYPDEDVHKRGEVLRDIGDAILEYDRIWSELKQD